MKKNKNDKIGIIGAGAAGLTAAETFKALGYNNITILEKNAYAGGKCLSYIYNEKMYELGAGLIAENNKTIFNLTQKYNIELRRVQSYTDNQYDIQTQKKKDDFFTLPDRISFLWQLLIKYGRLCHKYKSITEAGYQQMDLSLTQNFIDWAKEHKIPILLENFERYFTGFGYGYFDQTPAAFILKYIDWETVKSFVRGKFYVFPTGIQSLWQKVADHHKVIYNNAVQRIQRENNITVETNNQTYQFDYILISSPLDECLNIMSATEEEEFLFSKIEYNDYQSYAYSVNNFPNSTGFLPTYFNSNKKNQPMFWYKPYVDSNFYTFYVLGDWQTSELQIQQNIVKMITKFGGAIKQFHTCSKWKYFPRFSAENMKKGLYDRLENLQGKNNTFYIGELPSFSTVELTARYAKQLVESNF